MSNLRERAVKYAQTNFPTFPDRESISSMSYIDGAIEQHTIDIEMACQWMKDHLDSYVGEGGWNIFDSDPDCETYADVVARDFKKDMEKIEC